MKYTKLLSSLLAATALFAITASTIASAGTLIINNKHDFTETDFVVNGNSPSIRVVNGNPSDGQYGLSTPVYVDVPALGVNHFFVPSVTERSVQVDWSKANGALKVPYTVSDADGKLLYSGHLVNPEALVPPALGPALSQETVDSWNQRLALVQSNLGRPIYDEYTYNKYGTNKASEPTAGSRNVRGYW